MVFIAQCTCILRPLGLSCVQFNILIIMLVPPFSLHLSLLLTLCMCMSTNYVRDHTYNYNTLFINVCADMYIIILL